MYPIESVTKKIWCYHMRARGGSGDFLKTCTLLKFRTSLMYGLCLFAPSDLLGYRILKSKLSKMNFHVKVCISMLHV